MFLKHFLVKISVLVSLLATVSEQLAQEGCCSINPTLLYSVSSGGATIYASIFPSSGCFAFITPHALTTTTYNATTCDSSTFASSTTTLTDLITASYLASIIQNACSSIVVTDQGGQQILLYNFSNCTPTNPPYQTIADPVSGQTPLAVAANSTCVAAGYSNGIGNAALTAWSINANCTLPASFSSIDLSSYFPDFLNQVIFSSPASSCSFVVVTSGYGSPPANFVVVPLVGCTFGSPVQSYPQTDGTPVVAAASPDGRFIAVGFAFAVTNYIQIYAVEANCTLTATGPQVPITDIAISINYSPDGGCLACLNGTNTQFFPVNLTTGLLDSTGVTTLPINGSEGGSVLFSPNLTGCNMLAITGTNNATGEQGAFFYGRTSVLVAASSASICQGDSVTLTATAGYGNNYQWYINGVPSSESTTNVLNDTPSSSSSYYVTVTQSGCTITSNTVDVTVKPLPVINVTASSTSICAGDSVTLTATAGHGNKYQWFINGVLTSESTTNILIDTPSSSSSYYVIVTEAGCMGTSNTVDVTVNLFPRLTLQQIAP